MGWAKYYEDNISIYNNRMALRGLLPTSTQILYADKKPEIKPSARKEMVHTGANTNINRRYEIMIVLGIDIERIVGRKLQMNGWWFSKTKNCWCNCNTPINRQYAQNLSKEQGIKVVFVA